MLNTRIVKRLMDLRILALVLVVLFLSTEAQAAIYGFKTITNTYGEAWIGEQQLTVEVSDPGSNQVLFTFRNIGTYDCTVHEVYFEDGSLLQIYDDTTTTEVDGIINDFPNVRFLPGASPGNLPAGENLTPPFEATKAFSVDNTTAASYGLDPGEELGVLFDLQSGKTFGDVLTAISDGFTNPDPDPAPKYSLRIGLHVGGIGDRGESESYIMTPVPGALLLGLLGMGAAGMKLRKFA